MVRKRKNPRQPRMQSKSIDQLAAALAAAQSEMCSVGKNATNNYLGTKFADLAAVRDGCLGALNAHGIAVVQTFRPHIGGGMDPFKTTKERKGREYVVSVQILGYLRTQLCHASGQWMASELPLPANWGDPHAVGGAITYFRRYCLAAMVELAQEDDDGQRAKGQTRQPEPEKRAEDRKPAPRPQAASPATPKPEAPAAKPAAQASAPKAKSLDRPTNGEELHQYAITNTIDPYLKEWIIGNFVQRGYSISIKEWTPAQVEQALPDIKDHLQRIKLNAMMTSTSPAAATNGAPVANGVH